MRRAIATVFVMLTATSAWSFEGSSKAELEEFMAFLINSNGYLCAEVLSVTPTSTPDVYTVRCTEYGSGEGRATYRMNAATGSVSRG